MTYPKTLKWAKGYVLHESGMMYVYDPKKWEAITGKEFNS